MNLKLRILLVTETCFYPAYQGDSVRVYSLVNYFRNQGYEVIVLHFHDREQSHADYHAMAKLCDSLTIYYPTDDDLKQRNWEEMDSWCPKKFIDQAYDLLNRFKPDVMLVQYVFFSACFRAIEWAEQTNIVKVLEADNIFNNRSHLYLSQGLKYRWFSTTKEQEILGWNRADIILAIQEREYEIISKNVTKSTVLLMPQCIAQTPYIEPISEKILLFVGANNIENFAAMKSFIEVVFPRILDKHPEAKLKIAGGVCHPLMSNFNESLPKQVELMGVQDDLKTVYDDCCIVINPVTVGTGLKTKTVEALCYGKCLVSTHVGVDGLEKYTNIYYLANSPNEFTIIISELFSNFDKIRQVSSNAYFFASHYFNANVVFKKLLKKIFEKREGIHAN